MKPTPHSHEDALHRTERIAYLIAGHIRNTITPLEHEELDQWIVASDENLALFERLTDEDNIEEAMQRYRSLEQEKAAVYEELRTKIGL